MSNPNNSTIASERMYGIYDLSEVIKNRFLAHSVVILTHRQGVFMTLL